MFYNSPSGVESDMYEMSYGLILVETRTKLPDTKIIIMGPHVCHGHETDDIFKELYDGIGANRKIVEKLAVEYGCVYIDVRAIMDNAQKMAPANHWTIDGVHPTPAGHRLIADAWIDVYKNIM